MTTSTTEQKPKGITVIEAVENALAFLETNGYTGGDIHDDLAIVINKLRRQAPKLAHSEL